MERAILLADMNSFFASVHQALDPRLRGKPVVVIGDPEQRRGIVLSASYEAKGKGVKTGMILREARQVCDLVRNRFGRKTICRAASLIEGGEQ